MSLIVLNSCEKDEIKAVLPKNPKTPIIISPTAGTNFVLTAEKKDSTFWITWKEANFGFSASVSYSIQYATEYGNYVAKSNLYSKVNYNDSALIKIGDFNSKLMKDLALSENAISTIKVRIAAVISDKVDTVYSPDVFLYVHPNK